MPVSISNIPERPQRKNSPFVPVSEEYDNIWGFYTFSQIVSYNYNETTCSGLSSSQITINGVFTINAEFNGEVPYDIEDKDKCDILLSKYNKLRQYLLKTVNKTPPKNLHDIGTENDARCVKIPDKLLDNNGEYIYAIPNSFSATDISPEALFYTVSLNEPEKTPCKLSIEGTIINDASLTIVCRKPRINYRTYAFASGSEAYVTGINNRNYILEGNVGFYCDSSNSGSDWLNINDEEAVENVNINGVGFGLDSDSSDLISRIINKDKGVVSVGVSRADGTNTAEIGIMVISHNVLNNSKTGDIKLSISGEEYDIDSNSSSY